MSKYYLAVNPHGGLKKGLGILEQVKPVFENDGAELTILETEYAGHARNMARTVEIDGYDGFCAIGGDGTMPAGEVRCARCPFGHAGSMDCTPIDGW